MLSTGKITAAEVLADAPLDALDEGLTMLMRHRPAKEVTLAQGSPPLRDKLERYRLAKVRASLGVPSALHAAATELPREHRLHALERH